MKIETCLNAMVIADRRRISVLNKYTPNAQRQYRAFRDRIIRMGEERENWRVAYVDAMGGWQDSIDTIDELRKKIAEKQEYIEQLIDENIQNIQGMSAALTSRDARIAELEQELSDE